mmetsp:Transcript_897/g.3306  ORF Transcript_897/g.3306 Transcript_897/m.3306 type:complete len:216 (-) Transcript_897:160-807(-)
MGTWGPFFAGAGAGAGVGAGTGAGAGVALVLSSGLAAFLAGASSSVASRGRLVPAVVSTLHLSLDGGDGCAGSSGRGSRAAAGGYDGWGWHRGIAASRLPPATRRRRWSSSRSLRSGWSARARALRFLARSWSIMAARTPSSSSSSSWRAARLRLPPSSARSRSAMAPSSWAMRLARAARRAARLLAVWAVCLCCSCARLLRASSSCLLLPALSR